MKKEKINELLNEYRKTFSVDEEKDLKKFNSSERLIYIPKSINKKLVISGITFILVIALFFAVFYPIIIRNTTGDLPSPSSTSSPSASPTNSPNNNEPRYFDTGDLKYRTIDSIDIFNTENNCNVRKISIIEYMGLLIQSMILKEDDTVIGVRQNMSVWNEHIKDIRLKAYINNYDDESLNFHTLPYEVSWDSIDIRYNIVFDIYIYIYDIQFKQDGIIYKIEVECYDEIDINVLLNEILG